MKKDLCERLFKFAVDVIRFLMRESNYWLRIFKEQLNRRYTKVPLPGR